MSHEAGVYAKKQFGCQSRVIAWSHTSRFVRALRLVGQHKDQRLLDYGCGDGTFLERAAPGFLEAVGADISNEHLEDCRTRLADVTNLRFVHVFDVRTACREGQFDVVTCMETLEHCPEPIVDKVLDDLAWLCRPQGRVLISVPIETGLTLPAKIFFRKVAALRGNRDYAHHEVYPFWDLLRMVFATRSTQIERPVYGGPEAPSHSHYGFNWKRLRQKVQERFDLERTAFTPLPLVRGLCNSQAWFLCRNRAR